LSSHKIGGFDLVLTLYLSSIFCCIGPIPGYATFPQGKSIIIIVGHPPSLKRKSEIPGKKWKMKARKDNPL
jgi:hypothetical protein